MPPQATDDRNGDNPRQLLEERLRDVAIDEFLYRSDDDNTKGTNETLAAIDMKTLIWQVETAADTPIYIATALKMEQKVDLNILSELIGTHEKDANDIGNITMAPQEVAERLAGFPSGCIPPIAHTTPMPLYVDSSIAKNEKEEIVAVGSGIPGQSLLLPLSQLLLAAEKTGGVQVGPFVVDPELANKKGCDPWILRQEKKRERELNSRTQRKDRLKEYRRFKTNLVEKAKLLRSTARRKDLFPDLQLLVHEAVQDGDLEELLTVQPDEGLAKTALHMAAWRGNLRSVQLLIDTTRDHCPQLDAINLISKSNGSYGRTAIAYALTQCREDMVRLLIENGASLLFVNSKGQTPCSIAVSHLQKEACDYLFKTEAKQLAAGGSFQDYRGMRADREYAIYGDLDPRFPLDDFVYTEDGQKEVKQYEESVGGADPSTIINGIFTHFQPRSIQPTKRWWSENYASLEEAMKAKEAQSCKPHSSKTIEKKALKPRESSPSQDEPPEIRDVDSLDSLTVEGVLKDCDDNKIVLVNDKETIALVEKEIESTINLLTNRHDLILSDDERLVNVAWGLDCEWKPGVERGKDNPVATLQLSTRRIAFLIDLQSLCRPTNADQTTERSLTVLEMQLDNVLSKLFGHRELPLLGFGIMQDLGKLAVSFPYLKCFAQYASVVDLPALTSIIYPKSSSQSLASLQKVVALLLGMRLDKAQQCSDWSQRPLSSAQIEYAALDAAVLPRILEFLVHETTTIQRCKGQFFAAQPGLRIDLRYVFLSALNQHEPIDLPKGSELVWSVPNGSVRHALGKEVARQSWPSTQNPPAFPHQVVRDPNRITKKEKAHIAKVGTGKKPKPVQAKTLVANLNDLPAPGNLVGYTKDSCVERVVGSEFLRTLPERTHIGFNRRSGVVEMRNGFLLFCNFGNNPAGPLPRSSDFSSHGRQLSFHLKANRKNPCEKSLADYILNNGNNDESNEKLIFLFARGGELKQYVVCGTCSAHNYEVDDNGAIHVALELLDFAHLTGIDRASDDFISLVQWSQKLPWKSLEAFDSNYNRDHN